MALLTGGKNMSLLRLHLKPAKNFIPITISQNIWPTLIDYLQSDFADHSVFLFTDSHIRSLYEDTVNNIFSRVNNYRGIISFPAGEESKCLEQRDKLEDELLKARAGRDSLILAMGGGVTGDLVGFVAASLFRGIPLIQLPSSLIAQVDSSIGGKVGINHPGGKNLIGSFYQPEKVFIHVPFLQTLSPEEFSNGMAEVIKYGVTLDPDLWNWLEKDYEEILSRNLKSLEKMVEQCVRIKIEVVEKDPTEQGFRSILNFGHTIAHGIENLSKYRIKHGFAVAAGMKVAAMLSHQLLGYNQTLVERLHQTIELFSLNTVDLSSFSIDALWQSIQSDKKARNRSPRFTLLDSQSSPALFHQVTEKELMNALSALKAMR